MKKKSTYNQVFYKLPIHLVLIMNSIVYSASTEDTLVKPLKSYTRKSLMAIACKISIPPLNAPPTNNDCTDKLIDLLLSDKDKAMKSNALTEFIYGDSKNPCEIDQKEFSGEELQLLSLLQSDKTNSAKSKGIEEYINSK